MDKPISMSVKDYLMRVYSVRNNIPLKTIEAVVDFQFEEAHKALKDNYSVEISGFGKFIFNKRKALKIMEKQFSKIKTFTEKLNSPNCSDEKKKSWQNKIDATYKFIENLKPKIDGLETNTADLGGVEKQNSSFQENEGNNRENIPGKKVNM